MAPAHWFVPLVVIASCASSNLRLEIDPPADPIRLVAVAPALLRYQPDPYEIERRSEDVLAALWHHSQWPVLSPTEFIVIDENARDPLMGTDLLSRTRSLQLAPEHIGVLKTIISIREARGRAVVRGAAGTAVGRGYDGTAVITLELYSAGGRLVAEVEVLERLDPFVDKPDWDGKPEIRAAITRAVTTLVNACTACVQRVPAMVMDSYPSSATVMRAYRSVLRNPATWTRAAAGADRDLQIWRTMQYFANTIELDRAIALESRPPGFCLSGVPAPPLRPGDCVVAVNGAPATSPHTLRRARALAPPGAQVKLTVIGTEGIARSVPAP